MATARADAGVEGPQRVVPIGAHARPHETPAEPHRIVFMGSLLEKQGVQVALRALPLVRAEVPDAELLIIGDGPHRSALDRQVSKLRLGDAVRFTGKEDRAEQAGAEQCAFDSRCHRPAEETETGFSEQPADRVQP